MASHLKLTRPARNLKHLWVHSVVPQRCLNLLAGPVCLWQAKKLVLGDVGGTFSADEQIVLPGLRMHYLLNFMPYLFKMTKHGMDDFAELIGVRLTREHRRDSKDYCFRKLQHFFFQIYKMDLTCYDIEFPGF